MSFKPRRIANMILATLIFLLALPIHDVSAASSETIDARKGLVRLLSADVLEPSEYFFRSTLEYFSDGDLFGNNRDVYGFRANASFSYALFHWLLLNGSAGVRSSTQPISNFDQSQAFPEFSLSASSAYDLGNNWGWKSGRLTIGGSLWIDMSKITRIAKSFNFRPTFMVSTDWSDNPQVPVRAHFNVGFQPSNGGRHFDDSDIPGDFDRFGTHTLNAFAIPTGLGVELPFHSVTPSLEAHMEYVPDEGFRNSPTWVTLALKGKPFPQKNIELFGGVDVGLSKYTATPSGIKPNAYAIPLWNIVLGFGLSQFGKRANEIGVDQREYNRIRDELDERRETLAKLKRELSYNTIQGQVVDAETREPLRDVIVTFPENPNLSGFTTDKDGRFLKYFPQLSGHRIQFAKQSYVPSSKYLSLKPGESVTIDIALQEGSEILLGDLIVNLTDPEGNGVDASIRLQALDQETGPIEARTDSDGRIQLKLQEGRYEMEVQIPGYQPQRLPIEIKAESAVVRSFTIRSGNPPEGAENAEESESPESISED